MKKDVKVVVRYADGRVLKGTTLNFDPNRPMFTLTLATPEGTGDTVPVQLCDLKAVFFVRDFAGNPQHTDRKAFLQPVSGRRLSVRFADGESLVGASLTYSVTREGFFLFPADRESNNERVYVVQRAVSGVDAV